VELCRRCAAVAYSPDRCWFCESPQCDACWERYGLCAEPDCCARLNKLLGAATDDERRETRNRPIDATKNRRLEH